MMNNLTQQERDDIRLKADLETIRLAALIPKCYTPENRNMMNKIIITLIIGIILFVMFAYPGLAYAADPFAQAKAEITDTVGSGSTVQFGILAAGLVITVISGFVSKNWPASIGVFIVGMIFVNAGLKIVGM